MSPASPDYSSKSPGSWPRHCTARQCAGPSPPHRSSHVQLDPRDPVTMFLGGNSSPEKKNQNIKNEQHANQRKWKYHEISTGFARNDDLVWFIPKNPSSTAKSTWTRSRLPGSADYTSSPRYRSVRPSVPAANRSRPGRLNPRSLGRVGTILVVNAPLKRGVSSLQSHKSWKHHLSLCSRMWFFFCLGGYNMVGAFNPSKHIISYYIVNWDHHFR